MLSLKKEEKGLYPKNYINELAYTSRSQEMPFPVVFDQWGQNVQLNKPEFIDLGTLYGTPGFNTLSKDHRG